MNRMDASDLLAVETLLFLNRVKAAQEDSPKAHRELINWGAWSRHVTGLKPRLALPGWCKDYDTTDWNEESEVLTDEVKQRREADTEVKGEAREHELYRQLAAEKLNDFLHAAFEWRQRRCLSVIYFCCVPGHQYALRASRPKDPIDKTEFVMLLDGALLLIEREFA